MKRLLAALALFAVQAAVAADERERQDLQAIQQTLIQRDQQSAEFAHHANRGLQDLHSSQLRDAGRPLLEQPDPVIARQLLPQERSRMAQEREQYLLTLPPPVVMTPKGEKPLPLPGRPRPGVDPVAAPRVGG
jgi:hypothetical protein